MKSCLLRDLCLICVYALTWCAYGLESKTEYKNGILQPVTVSKALKTDLARYGLVAGCFIRADSLPEEGGRRSPNRVGYLLFEPKKARSRTEVPMVVYLPGRGELGNSLDRLLHDRTVFERVTASAFQRQRPCYLLALQPPASAATLLDGLPGQPSPVQMLLHDAIREVVRTRQTPRVDENRIYLTGLSYGGGGVYGLMTSYPGQFACGVPVAAFPPPPFFVSGAHRIWHCYNEGDYRSHGLTVAMLRPFSKAVEKAGGEFRVGQYAANGHDAWSAAWKEEAVWDWMFSCSLDGRTEPLPSLKASTPLKAKTGFGVEFAVDGLDGTWFESAASIRKGDILMGESPSPLNGTLVVLCGKGVANLCVETSSDGDSWRRLGVLPARTGRFRRSLPSGVRFVRLSAMEDAQSPIRVYEVRVEAR